MLWSKKSQEVISQLTNTWPIGIWLLPLLPKKTNKIHLDQVKWRTQMPHAKYIICVLVTTKMLVIFFLHVPNKNSSLRANIKACGSLPTWTEWLTLSWLLSTVLTKACVAECSKLLRTGFPMLHTRDPFYIEYRRSIQYERLYPSCHMPDWSIWQLYNWLIGKGDMPNHKERPTIFDPIYI